MKKHLYNKSRIDHIAIAVKDIEQAVCLYESILGFTLISRREIKGKFSGMESAELEAGGVSLVLVQGTDDCSQVSRYIDEYGPGVQHVAIEVDDVVAFTETLSQSGVQFATDIIWGESIIQRFTQRDVNTGMMFEFIQRVEHAKGFEPTNIQQLFEQLELRDAY